VAGNATVKPDETFTVNFSNVTGTTITITSASGTIQNDTIADAVTMGVVDNSVFTTAASYLACLKIWLRWCKYECK
jgi:hypothetical protein